MSTSETLIQILTLIIALYGAIFSTILAIRQGRNRVTVRCDVDTLTTAEGTEYVVEVSALNVGHRALEIRELGFKDEYGTALSKKFEPPEILELGKSIMHHFTYEEVRKKLHTFTTVFAEDTRRRSYSAEVDSRSKELILYGPLLEPLTKSVRSLGESAEALDKLEKLHEQVEERRSRTFDEIESNVQRVKEESQRKHKEWDDYRTRTGETHPEQQKLVDDTLRYIHEADKNDDNEEQESNDRV